MSEGLREKMAKTLRSPKAVYTGVAVVSLIASIALGWKSLCVLGGSQSPQALVDHAPALFGMPFAITAALTLVCCARALDPQAHIDFLGLRVRGAAATIVCWIVVFAVLTIAIRALW
ncbi:hypothetical protein [Sphingomonas zeae]|uniref:Uncharacterized protein n=1 Tax=Sphingomonas zeae TaxID=1646122 RepID=A0A7Y6B254_9SPHN|nr:hypothetical protein [Sphingomonas zeae]MBB4050301.1 hypothetical protein [Sphingomonas zeae]NUU46047.1 hypothetical protein [Sphingomonas zeae]